MAFWVDFQAETGDILKFLDFWGFMSAFSDAQITVRHASALDP